MMGDVLDWLQLIVIIVGFAGMIKTFGVKEGRQTEKNDTFVKDIKDNKDEIDGNKKAIGILVKDMSEIKESLSYIKGQLVGGNVIKK